MWAMTNLNNYAEILGKRIIIDFVLIDLKREIEEVTVSAMKAKTHILDASPKRNFFWLALMLYSIRNTEDFEKLEELASLPNQLEDLRLQDNLGNQNFQEDMKKI